jgi:superfamily II DNA or RNA helicase
VSPELTHRQVRSLFDSATLERGIGYVRQRRVLHLDVQRDGRLVSALVRGNARRPYRVVAQIGRDRLGTLTVHGSCSCPVRYNCKHVAAALWSAAVEDVGSAEGPALPPEVDSWLAQLARAGASPAPAETDEALLYVVALTEASPGRLAPIVEAHVIGRRKDGRPGRPRRLPLTPELLASRFDVEDLRVAALVAAAHGGSGGGLYGPLAGEALRAALATGRTRLELPDGPPLRLGEPRRATPRWELTADGRQQLALGLEVDQVLLDLGEPWYLDAASGQCGRVETGLEPALVAPLLRAPALTPVAAAAVAERLARVPALAALPSPRTLEVQEIARQRPVPCLTLLSVPTAPEPGSLNGRDAWDHHVRLAFDYGGHRIPAGQQAASVHFAAGEGLVRIVRDAKAEKAAVERLEQLGLVSGFWSDGEADLFFPEEDLDGWVRLLARDFPALARDGWRIEEAPGFRLHPLEADDWYAEVADGGAWFDLELGVEVDGKRLPVVPLLVQLLAQLGRLREGDPLADTPEDAAWYVTLPEGGILRLPAARVRTILGTLLELYDPGSVRQQAVRLPRLAAHRLAEIDGLAPAGVRWHGAEALRALGERLRGFRGIARAEDPPGLRAELRDYQRDGLAWLQFLREYQLGGVLADDMGLGKTVQALAHVLTEKAAGRLDRPALVVAPTSLVVNWRREAERFTPDLRVLVLHGPERKGQFPAIPAHDLVVTTYPLLPRDLEALAAHEYHLLVLDEAHNIKNPKTKASAAVRGLRARHRLCLTGTPMENHLGELWALFDLLLPGLLGDERRFRRTVRVPVEQHGDQVRREALARRIAPFLLRRTKGEVVSELPPRTDITRTVALGPRQRDLYETVRAAMHEKVRQAIARRGLERSRIEVLEALLRLRQICCDPRLLEGDKGGARRESAKLELLLEMLPELVEEGRRILLFSQFTQMIALIETELARLGITYLKLTGQTRDRAGAVDRFQAGQVPVFLVSLKAGGSGLNLTAADTVIHYDPWWNPAVERQATDRAHRIGQDKPVFAYKLLTEGTVEEKIAELQARKAALADALLGEGQGATGALSADDLEGLFEPL